MDQTRAQSLIRTQIELEYALDANGDLVPYPGSTEQARFIVHRHSTGYVRFYRRDLPARVRRQLAALPESAPFDDTQSVKATLAIQAACSGTFFGTSGLFSRRPDRAEFADVAHTSEGFVILVEGVAASTAWSARENDTAAELAVETATEHRRRGYARQVAAAWAHHVMAQGKVAFYSYAEGNIASEALARCLGVVEFSTVAAYE